MTESAALVEEIAHLQSLGAAAVQLGTPFVAAQKCDAHIDIKRPLAFARDADVVAFTSVAGLSACAVMTRWLRSYLDALPRLRQTVQKNARCALAWDCLARCGLRNALPG